MTTTQTKKFGELTVGTVINYTNLIIAENVDYVILEQYTDKWGNYTKVLNKETNEIDSFTQKTLVYQRWSIVKEN